VVAVEEEAVEEVEEVVAVSLFMYVSQFLHVLLLVNKQKYVLILNVIKALTGK
jgi:hypothetical protein